MGLDEWSVVRTRAVVSERESTGLIARSSGSGKMMRERGSFDSGAAAQINGLKGLPRTYRKLCKFKKMLSQ